MTPHPPDSRPNPPLSVVPPHADNAVPPPLPPPLTPQAIRQPKPWSNWLAAFLVLTFYPLLIGMISYLSKTEGAGPMLMPELLPLVITLSVELMFFGVIFLVAWVLTRPTAHQLFFRRDRPWKTLLLSLGWSVGLRFGLGILVAMALAVVAVFQGGWPEDLSGWSADINAVVDSEQLANNPLYLIVNMTFVSFVVAGFREELWRAGMLACLMMMFPRLRGSLLGRIGMVLFVAAIFGLGHLPQGVGGVCLTAMLGAGLGAIMVWRWSIWEAVLAHGFFNAASFGLLYVIARYPETFKALSEQMGK